MSEMVCKEESASEDEPEELIIKNESGQQMFVENDEFHVNNANPDNVTIIETPFSDAEDKTKGSGKGFALGSISEKIVPWLQSRYELKEGGKTAIQEVITLYNHDFPRDCVYFPLESFQVGQLVRQAFPEIALCKVTCKESKKRYRCYKGLTRREADSGPSPIFPYELPKVQKRKSKPASQKSPKVIYMQVTALQDPRAETPPGISGHIASCKIKLPQLSRPSSSRPFPQLRVQPPKPDMPIMLSSASTSPNSSLHSPLTELAPSKQEPHNPYFVPFCTPHTEQKEKAHKSPPKKTCKLELVPLSSEQSADSISTHQQEMLCELPTMVAAVPTSSASKRKLEIGKLHVTQSLDYIERQAYAQEDFQEIEDFILERLDQIRSKQFGL